LDTRIECPSVIASVVSSNCSARLDIISTLGYINIIIANGYTFITISINIVVWKFPSIRASECLGQTSTTLTLYLIAPASERPTVNISGLLTIVSDSITVIRVILFLNFILTEVIVGHAIFKFV
jgi:hypothetical protein